MADAQNLRNNNVICVKENEKEEKKKYYEKEKNYDKTYEQVNDEQFQHTLAQKKKNNTK